MDAVQFLVLCVLLGSSGGSADFSIFRESFGWTFSSNIRAAEAAALDAWDTHICCRKKQSATPLRGSGERGESPSKAGGSTQSVYETRFVAYLARFLLVVDPAAGAWWKIRRVRGERGGRPRRLLFGSVSSPALIPSPCITVRFVSVARPFQRTTAALGLSYGSYASVAAAKAGIAAAEPAKLVRQRESSTLWDAFGRKSDGASSRSSPSGSKRKKNQSREAKKLTRQGVLNLLSLLKARYTAAEQKRQLALLFSLISDPELQPVNEIRSLLGEVDNGTIAWLYFFGRLTLVYVSLAMVTCASSKNREWQRERSAFLMRWKRLDRQPEMCQLASRDGPP